MTDDLYMYKRFLKTLAVENEQRVTDLIARLDHYRLYDNAVQRYMDSDELIEEALDAIHHLREKVRQLRVKLKTQALENEQRLTDLIERLNHYLLHSDAVQRWIDADNLIDDAQKQIHHLREEVRRLQSQLRVEEVEAVSRARQ